MGYESKIIIVERAQYTPNIISALVVAQYDLCNMGYKNREFYDVFKTEIDYDLYLPNGDEIQPLRMDCYGKHMKSADIGELIAALKVCDAREHYRRIPPLIAMLESFDLGEWNSDYQRLEAVHYAY